MHLTTKQILTLIFPFFLTAVVYMVDMDIVKNVKYLFPNYEEYTNKSLDKKAVIYLQIESKDKFYQEIQNAIVARKENASWIVENVLYKKVPKELKRTPKQYYVPVKQKKVEKRINFNNFKLQAVFSKDKVAIINGHFVKESSYLNGVQILQIKQDSVLLGYQKGKKWIYLFH